MANTESMSNHDYWMRQALDCAKQAQECNEVPVGAVVVKNGSIIGLGQNACIHSCDPSAHAEIIAIRQAANAQNNYRLTGTTLYVTLEPCAMCVGAIAHARIDHVVYGATDPKRGAVLSCFQLLDQPMMHHKCKVTSGILAEECGTLLKQFFRGKRKR